MKSALLALLLGVMLGFALGETVGSSAPAVAPIPPADSPPLPAENAGPAARRAEEPLPHRIPAPAPPRVEGRVDIAAGECMLRIGDGLVFGAADLRPRDARDQVDIYCLDIRGGATLACRLGAAPAPAPLTAHGLPDRADAAAGLLQDAPPLFADHTLQLSLHPKPEHAGIGFVRSQSGSVFVVWLIEVGEDADALMRWARIRFRPVPVVAGGGSFHLPQTLGAPSAASLQAIRNAIDVGKRIPGQNFTSYLGGDFVAVEAPGQEATLRGGELVFEGLLAQKVELAERAAVFVGGGLGRDAAVVLRRGGAAGVGGNLEGLLRTDGYAYLFVGGDLNGTLDIRSYTTAVVLGDVRGTIRVRSYTDLYVRGRILGTLDFASSGWCTFYFQSFLGRADLERLQGSGEITLHLMQSDLDAGRHTGVGKWREVIVGDPLWQQLAR